MVFAVAILTGFISTAIAEPMLLASWNFDTLVGNTFIDNSDHGYNATWTGNGVGIAPGMKGNALSCPGSGYEIVVPNSNNDFNVTTFTIESWFYSNIPPSQISVGAKIFDFQAINSGIYNGYGVHINPDGNVEFGISSSTGDAWETAVSATALQAKTWYYIVCSYDGSFVRVYVNGILDASTAYKGTYSAPHADARIACQRLTDGPVRCFVNGKLDELKLYNYALPSDSIAAHFSGLSPAPVLIPYTPDPTYERKPTLQWHPVQDAFNYTIQISSAGDFTHAFLTDGVVDTFYSPTIDLPIGKIYWHVKSNVSELFSTTDTFIINQSSNIGSKPDQNAGYAGKLSVISKRSSISILYWVEQPGMVSLTIYSLTGKKIETVLNGISFSGRNTCSWDGTDRQGNIVPNGCYRVVFNSSKQKQVESITLLR
jgi:hypothetical protein